MSSYALRALSLPLDCTQALDSVSSVRSAPTLCTTEIESQTLRAIAAIDHAIASVSDPRLALAVLLTTMSTYDRDEAIETLHNM